MPAGHRKVNTQNGLILEFNGIGAIVDHSSRSNAPFTIVVNMGICLHIDNNATSILGI